MKKDRTLFVRGYSGCRTLHNYPGTDTYHFSTKSTEMGMDYFGIIILSTLQSVQWSFCRKEGIN